MAALKLREWNSAEHLQTEEDMALYLEACLQEAGDDAAFIAKALGTIARAKGMSQVARDTGLGRESLYKALSGEGNPSFATILKVTTALGIRLHAAPLRAGRRPLAPVCVRRRAGRHRRQPRPARALPLPAG